jgi:hypothetical protein
MAESALPEHPCGRAEPSDGSGAGAFPSPDMLDDAVHRLVRAAEGLEPGAPG